MNQVTRGIIFSFLTIAIFFATILPSPTFAQFEQCHDANGNPINCDLNINNTNTTGGINGFGGNTNVGGTDFSGSFDSNANINLSNTNTDNSINQFGGVGIDTSNPNTNTLNAYTGDTPSSKTQGVSYVNGAPASKTASSSQAATLSSCLGGKALSNFISQKIGGLISHDQFVKVGVVTVSDPKKVGDSSGFPPSWDSIAYCLLNEIIAKVANDTIAWINSGFNGNPAFVSDPKKFFTDIANNEAANFIKDVAYGATGLNICQPFRVQISTGLNSAYNKGYGQQSACTLGSIGQNIQNFQAYTSGGTNSGAGNLQNLWQVGVQGQNQYQGYLLAQQELNRRISLQQNTAKVDLSNGSGFLSFKECAPTPDKKDSKGATVKQPDTCRVVTPGKVIESQLNNRLSSGNNRLILADKFDQVVDALVQQLIKTALNKVLSQ